MVTRTFKSTIINYKAALVNEEKIEELTLKAPRVFTDEEAAYKYVKKTNKDSNIRPLMVVSLIHDEQLYGCTDEQFLTVAVPINSRRTLNSVRTDGPEHADVVSNADANNE